MSQVLVRHGATRSTLARATDLITGVGIHMGEPATVTLHPSPEGGFVFRARTANGGWQEIPAQASNVVDTARCTVLGTNGTTVSTVEHLLSALLGLDITDCIIEVDGPELPIGDGSAGLWVDAIQAAGVKILAEGARGRLRDSMIVMGRGGAFIAAYPADTLSVTVAISFENSPVGTQIARYDRGVDYATEVAPARTFGFAHEVEQLRAAGLARGGSLENAIIVGEDGYSVPLLFPNELARHKLLDFIGDLALAGVGLPTAQYIAVRPSHKLNTEFAARLLAIVPA